MVAERLGRSTAGHVNPGSMPDGLKTFWTNIPQNMILGPYRSQNFFFFAKQGNSTNLAVRLGYRLFNEVATFCQMDNYVLN